MKIDKFTPDPIEVTSGNTTTIDGTNSSTNSAIIATLVGGFDAQIFYEAYDSSTGTWQEIALIGTDGGQDTFTADWSTQGNRWMVSDQERRLRIENVDSGSGFVAVDGDQI